MDDNDVRAVARASIEEYVSAANILSSEERDWIRNQIQKSEECKTRRETIIRSTLTWLLVTFLGGAGFILFQGILAWLRTNGIVN